jgi:predicted XRE-type DNA-binding protein
MTSPIDIYTKNGIISSATKSVVWHRNSLAALRAFPNKVQTLERSERRTLTMRKTSDFIDGSYNVFADIGLKDAEDHFAKAALAHHIIGTLKQKKLTQQEAAKRLETTQAKISDIVRGKLDQFTLDRLIRMLLAFDQDIAISCTPKPRSRPHATLTVQPPHG